MVIYQGDEKLCGWAATRMLLVSLTHARAYARLSLRGKPPYNLLHLAEGARAAGVELTFKRAYDKASIRRARRFPLLLVLGSEEEGHMVLLRGRLGSLFVLDDPAAGRRLVSFRKLLASWSGVYGEGRRVEKLVPPRAKRPFVPFYGRFLTPLLEGLVAILLAVGFFFLGDDLLFLSPLFLLAAGFLLIARQRLSIRLLKDLDRRGNRLLARSRNGEFRECYVRFQRLKKEAVGDMTGFFSSLFAGLVLLFLLGLNAPSFLASGALLALYLLLEGTLGARKGRQEAKELASDEEKALSARFDAEQRMASLADLERRAYRLADRFSYRRLVYAALVLLLALIPPLLEGPFNLNYYLFTAFGLFGVGLASRGCVDYCALAPSRKGDLDFYDQRLDPTPVS